MKNLLRRTFSSLLLLGLLSSISSLYAEEVVLKQGHNQLSITTNTDHRLGMKNTFTSFHFKDVKTSRGIFSRVTFPQHSKRGQYGGPELPVNSQFIEVPAGASVDVRILHMVTREYTLEELGMTHPLYPMQPPISKSDEPRDFEYDAQLYRTDAFLGAGPVTVEVLGTMRGLNIARLDVAPVEYHPLRKVIRVYEELEFELVFRGGDIARTHEMKRTYYHPFFSGVYNSIINYRDVTTANRDTITRYPVKYVIVSDPMFEDQLQPFIEWKTRKGFQVVEAYTDDPGVGTTTYQIKSYLQGLYDNATPDDPAPTFVLFVGDVQQVPAWTGQAAGHVTDLYYVEYTNDYFPEAYYGRFSAQNNAQLQPQIDKTLMYEQYTMDDPSYLEEVVMIAGMDGNFGPSHGNGQINYGTINYFNEDHDILSHTYLYPESGSNAANIRQHISDGVSFANYTAHGSPSGWADPSFTTSHIPALENEGQYGLLVGNCCSTSEYQVGECFGEALLRAEDKGALGYIGASNSTYWDEDYYFGVGVGTISGNPPSYEETTLGYYDRAFHDHGEPFTDWYTTMDQMIYSGNLAVTLGSPGSATYYWEAYCLMGDPSLMVYLGVPATLQVTYDPLIPLGSPAFTVMAAPYAYVALSMDGTLLGAALADSTGEATLSLEGVTTPGSAEVVATAQGYQPFLGTVLIANPEGPYVLLNEWLLVDSVSGNGNGQADAGESLMMDGELKNWGGADAQGVTATLILQDSAWITVQDDYQEYGLIPANDSVLQTGAYAFQVLDSIPDMAAIGFEMVIEDDSRETWSSNFNIVLHAPVLHIENLTLVDDVDGNGNGRLDPGETVDIYLHAGNTGHCDAMDALTTLTSSSENLVINVDSCLMDTLVWGNMYDMYFNVTIGEEAQPGDFIDLAFSTASGPYSRQKDFSLPVGLIIEDFETGDFSSFGWMSSGDQPWIVTTSEKYEGEYSAVSGDIDDMETSVLFLDMEVSTADSISFYRKVSCEDDPYNDNYDWLAFYIDNVEMERWDGEVEWSRVAYPVTAGTRTFKWVYSKDYSVSSGYDAAWVDYITLPGVAQYVTVEEVRNTKNLTMSVYPNPASEKAIISIRLQEEEQLSLEVFDLMGRSIMTPVKDRRMVAGNHSIECETGGLPAGIYLVSLETGQGRITRKLIRK